MKKLLSACAVLVAFSLPAKAVTLNFADDYNSFKKIVKKHTISNPNVEVYQQLISNPKAGFSSWAAYAVDYDDRAVFTIQMMTAPVSFNTDFPTATTITSPSGTLAQITQP